jgi:hypothetical protein
MVRQHAVAAIGAAALLALIVGGSAQLWGAGSMSYLTVGPDAASAHVALPPGTYTFATAPGVLDIVRVLDKERSKGCEEKK